ncbi:MAG TPA: DoxX family protein [Candidatus Binataceae bacterium]|nr:DoxX family protein [Candidatus Binataceae bacterium]
MDKVQDFGSMVGRVMLAIIFALSGFGKLRHLGMTIAMMEKAGMQTMVGPLALAAALIEFVGGLMLIAGFRTRTVAFILFLFLIPVTIIFHVVPGGMMNQVNTVKNIAIMGGLLLAATLGAGGYSVDSIRKGSA